MPLSEQKLETIAMWCRSYLFNYQHISRKGETERCIRELQKAVNGVSVSRMSHKVVCASELGVCDTQDRTEGVGPIT